MDMVNRLLLFIVVIVLHATPLAAMEVDQSQNNTIAWGLFERQGVRETMEDAYVYSPLKLLPSEPEAHYFGLFDGHGGDQAAQFAAEKAVPFFMEAFSTKQKETALMSDDIKLAFDKSYKQLDTKIQE